MKFRLNRIFCTCILFSLLTNHVYSQKYLVDGTISNLRVQKVYLTASRGYDQKIIDSAIVDKKGHFKFTMSTDNYPGIYRLLLGKTMRAEYYGEEDSYLDLIFNNEDILFSTDLNELIDSMRVYISKENKVYFDYQKKDDKLTIQLDVLNQMPQFFPREDPFYKTITF